LVEIGRLLDIFGIVTELLFIVKIKVISFSDFPNSIYFGKYNIYRNVLVPVINISISVIRKVLFIGYKILAIREF
jgi:hypothetical protein